MLHIRTFSDLAVAATNDPSFTALATPTFASFPTPTSETFRACNLHDSRESKSYCLKNVASFQCIFACADLLSRDVDEVPGFPFSSAFCMISDKAPSTFESKFNASAGKLES